MSSTFLFVCSDAWGHLLRNCAVVAGLAARGHRAIVYAPPPARPAVEAAGGEFVAFERYGELDVLARVKRAHQRLMAEAPGGPGGGRLGALRQYLRRLAASRGAILEATGPLARDVGRALAEHRPDALVADSFCFGARYAAEAAGVPFATFSGEPHLSLLMTPDRALRLGNPARPVLVPHALWRPAIDALLPLARVRRELGLPPQHRTAEFFDLMHSERLHLVACLPEMVPGEPLAGDALVGPLAFDWRPAAAPPPEDPGDAIVVAWSTMGHLKAVELYHRLMGALAEVDLPALALTGGLDRLRGAPVGPRVRVIDTFVPHHDLLPRARAIITHGGWGTVGRALRAGVPMLILPAFGPHPVMAKKLEALGLAHRLAPEALDGPSLRRALRALLDDEGLRARLRAMRERLAAVDSPVLAAQALERLVAGAPGARA